MEQSELGKTEEENVKPSATELSDSETVKDVSDSATEVDVATEPVSAEAPVEGEAETTASDEQASTAEGDTPPAKKDDEKNDTGLKRGQLITGKIKTTSPTSLEVEFENGVVGIVPGRELEMMTRKMIEELAVGADIEVMVVNPKNHRGETVLSINHALDEQDWRTAEEYRQSKEVYDGKIGGYNKGGLIVRFGRLRGFVPQSQVADIRTASMKGETPEERYGSMVNGDISVKVMEVDRSRNRLILSERAAMREVRQRRKESLITELQVGEERTGIVVSLENFGAFVDIGGAEGLIHLTEISWKHITHPRQVLNIGQEVTVKVISVDPQQNRIGLSLKQLQQDPWDEVATLYGNGALVRGVVTKLTKFGAFARIEHNEESVEGLIHISELAESRIEHPKEVVKKGEELTLRVVKVDVKNRRLGLSLKRVNSSEYLDRDLKRAFAELDAQPTPIADATPEPVAEEPATEESAPEADTPAEE